MFGTKFWEGIAAGASRQWTDRLFSPALAFWVGGVAAWATAHDPRPLLAVLTADGAHQAVLAIAGLLLVAASDRAAEDAQLSVLRVMEGYWPDVAEPLRRVRVHAVSRRVARMRARWTELAPRYDALSAAEREEYARLDAVLSAHPAPSRLLPTRLGNLLRSAEDYASRRYGLATGVVWPRLWLVMPDEVREELSRSRGRLDASAQLSLWSVLFLGWSIWAWWWVVPAAIVAFLFARARALEAAGVFGELLRASFDLHRAKLYDALRWPQPRDPADEHARGQELSEYLWRGSAEAAPKFTVAGSSR